MSRRRRRLSWPLLVAAVALPALAIIAAVSMVATVHAQHGPIPGGVYNGTLVDSDVSCSQGGFTLGEEFTLRLNSEGSEATAIVEMTVHEVSYLFDPVGTYTWPLDIAINSDGSFEDEFDVNGLAFVQVEGRFQGDTVSGSFRVDVDGVVECDGTFTAQGFPPRPPEPSTWTAPIGLNPDGCGGGVVSITVSSDRSSVIRAGIADFKADGVLVSGSAAFDKGTVPLVAKGSFRSLYFPGSEPGQEIALSGAVAGALSGIVTVSPSTCGPVAFRSSGPTLGSRPGTGGIAAAGAGGPRSAAAFADSNDASLSAAVPESASDTTTQRSRIGPAWTALAAGGALVLLVGLALLRRRPA